MENATFMEPVELSDLQLDAIAAGTNGHSYSFTGYYAGGSDGNTQVGLVNLNTGGINVVPRLNVLGIMVG